MVLKACLGFLITSCIGQLQWSWYLQARPLKDVVLFHEAAHGILGSMQWMYIYRLRQPLTALGALITILALAIDPFTQQLVRATDCSEKLPKDIPASVPRTNSITLDDETTGIPFNLQSTILAGLYTFPNLTDFDCLSGNCTFQNTYSSLSICSQCSDRSSEVVINKDCHILYLGPESDTLDKQVHCNASTPNSSTYFNLTTSWSLFDLNFYSQGTSGAGQAPEMFSIQASEKLNDTDMENPNQLEFAVTLGYSDSAILRHEPTSNDPLSWCDDSVTNETWRCRGYGAALCVLKPCIRTYSCSIEAGRLQETIVEDSDLDQRWGLSDPVRRTIHNTLVSKPLLGLLDLQCITDADRGNLAKNGYDVSTASRWLSYNVTFDPSTILFNASPPFPESLLVSGCLYIIDARFLSNLGYSLVPIFVGSVTRNGPTSSEDPGFYFVGKEQVLHLYNSGNVSMASINETFANLAQALTLWFRSNGDARFSHRAEGAVLHYAVCVRVTWAWIALPVALTGLALVMLALTVATTARTAVPMWKLFPLAVLLCGPAGDDWLDRNLLASNPSKFSKTSCWDGSVAGMSGLASRVSVQLLEQDGKFQLRQVGAQAKKVQQ